MTEDQTDEKTAAALAGRLSPVALAAFFERPQADGFKTALELIYDGPGACQLKIHHQSIKKDILQIKKVYM